MVHVDFKFFVDKPHIIKRIERKKLRVLSKTGAFGRTVMKRQIRPPKSGRKSRTVVMNGRQYYVPPRGRVIDVATSHQTTTELANAARRLLAARLGHEGAGKPPRRGPTDLLRSHIYFGVDVASESVVVGPMQFATTAHLTAGIKSIPELLEKGGGEYFGDLLVMYAPHPFAAPSMDETQKKMRGLIESEPL